MIFAEILTEKGSGAELFQLASFLNEQYRSQYVTYYVIGMFNYYLGKFELSRKYFNKTIQSNRGVLNAWVMLGHSYA